MTNKNSFELAFNALLKQGYWVVGVAIITLLLVTYQIAPLPWSFNTLLTLGIAASVMLLGVYWINQTNKRHILSHQEGIKALELKSKHIINQQYDAALNLYTSAEPKLAADAMDKLIAQLWQYQTSSEQLNRYIRQNIYVDSITGLGSRQFFLTRLNAFCHDELTDDHGVMLLIQLTDLHEVCQQVGFDENTLLRQAAYIISDVMSQYSFQSIARYEDFCFAVLATQLSQKESEKLCVRLLQHLMEMVVPKSISVANLFHVGAVYFASNSQEVDVSQDAYQALRAAQLQGESGWFMYERGNVDNEMEKGSVRWRTRIDEALSNRRFNVFAQPVYDRADNVSHLECFARLINADGSITSPATFFPMARIVGMDVAIEKQIVEQIITELIEQESSVPLSVNLSAGTLGNREFIAQLVELAEEEKIRSKLIVEMNEQYIKQRNVLENLHQLAQAGYAVCIDCGGQSIVTQEVDISWVNCLKLHRTLVRQLPINRENQLLIKAVISEFQPLGINIYAEGVETEDEKRTLLALGVDGYQGIVKHAPKPLSAWL